MRVVFNLVGLTLVAFIMKQEWDTRQKSILRKRVAYTIGSIYIVLLSDMLGYLLDAIYRDLYYFDFYDYLISWERSALVVKMEITAMLIIFLFYLTSWCLSKKYPDTYKEEYEAFFNNLKQNSIVYEEIRYSINKKKENMVIEIPFALFHTSEKEATTFIEKCKDDYKDYEFEFTMAKYEGEGIEVCLRKELHLGKSKITMFKLFLLMLWNKNEM